MNQFTLIVTKSPFDSRNAESAIRFCNAAISRGDIIKQVFFYQSGVHNASSLLQSNSDEFDTRSKWVLLAKEHGVRLNVCVTAALRRGVMDNTLAEPPTAANLQPPFCQVGLSDYFVALAEGSINVQF